VRGPGGGYRLSRSSAEIFVAQIIDAVTEAVDATGCGGTSDCQQGEVCLTHHLWCDLSEQIHTFLSEISLADLVARREVQSISARQEARSQQSGEETSAAKGERLALAEV
jgi:Rrf2 family iron-sulfur cluster assembly transcriptional regulator